MDGEGGRKGGRKERKKEGRDGVCFVEINMP